MPDDRPGGPIAARFVVADGGVSLRFEDVSAGGGLVLHFPNAAWAQTWLDDLATQLADLDVQRVFG